MDPACFIFERSVPIGSAYKKHSQYWLKHQCDTGDMLQNAV